ncbi:hypothetical protein MKX03_025045, partial [Papaver bracteatum]
MRKSKGKSKQVVESSSDDEVEAFEETSTQLVEFVNEGSEVEAEPSKKTKRKKSSK